MDQQDGRKFYNTALFRQCILSLCISLSYFNIGTVRGYSSTAFPSMKELRPDLLPSKDIWSWAGSIAPFGGFIGSVLSGPLLHYVGRKRTVCIASPVGAIAWAMIATASSWPYLIFGRILCGVCAGLCLPSAQIYVTECTDAKIRGVIGSFPSMAMSAGILLAYIMGTFLRWDLLAWMCAGFSLMICGAVGLLPESPTWLLTRDEDEQAVRSRKWLKLSGGLESSLPGGGKLLQPADPWTPGEMEDRADQTALSWSVLLSRPVLRPWAIGLTLLLIQQLSGIDAVIFFTVDIFRASGSTIDDNVATIIVGALQLGSNLMALFVVDRAGRKPLLIGSALVMSIAMGLMGVAFKLNALRVEGFGFLPLFSLMLFMVGFSVGFGSIPFLLMGELFPAAQRSLMSSVAGSFNLLVMFLVIKTYHPLETMITTAGTFWAYSALCAAGCFFVIEFVPETRGRDSDEIAQLFEPKVRTVKIRTMDDVSDEYNLRKWVARQKM